MTLVHKHKDGTIERKTIAAVRFVPMTGDAHKEGPSSLE